MELLEDHLDLLSAFHAHGVRFLIVGGHAVNMHTEPRYTGDLDVLVSGDEENGPKVFRALASFGAPLAGMTPQDFIGKPKQYYQMGVPPARVDVLQSIPEIDFEQAWENASVVTIAGQTVRFLSRADLIRNKLAAGRLKDLADVEQLRLYNESTDT